MIHPYLDYGIMLWGTANKTQIKPLQKIQNKAVRIITNSQYNTLAVPLYKQLNILTLDDMHKMQIGKFMYELSQNNLPRKLIDLFTPNCQTHEHNTRQKNEPHVKSWATLLREMVSYIPLLNYDMKSQKE